MPPVCRALRIPNTTMFDYEWATLQHHVICRLATSVLVPEAIPPERLRRYGATPPKLVRYPGLKEEYYLADFEPDLLPLVLRRLESQGCWTVVLTRTPEQRAAVRSLGLERAIAPERAPDR